MEGQTTAQNGTLAGGWGGLGGGGCLAATASHITRSRRSLLRIVLLYQNALTLCLLITIVVVFKPFYSLLNICE